MRWMKRLLLAIYLYMGILFAACYVSWLITGEEPTSLIMGVSAAVGVESIAAGAIRIYENIEQNKHEKEMHKNGKQDQLETETDQP